MLQHIYTVAEVQLKRGGGKALQISDKFVLILHIFLIIMEKYENDKNDFLQTQGIKQLDKYSLVENTAICIQAQTANVFTRLLTFYYLTFAV